MRLGDAEKYFLDRAEELLQDCKAGTPWVFLSASAFLEFLTKLANGRETTREDYKRFIEDYMSRVRPEYKNFRYKSGTEDLPVQMYHVLRCGIIHSFSFTPDEDAVRRGGRARSIVLCHEPEAKRKGLAHLMQYSGPQNLDAALFVAKDFVRDLQETIKLVFNDSKTDPALRANIETWVKQYPPITGGF